MIDRLKLRKINAFSLLEIVFVIFILGLIFVLSVSGIYRHSERNMLRRLSLETQFLSQAIEIYFDQNYDYPLAKDTNFIDNYISTSADITPWGAKIRYGYGHNCVDETPAGGLYRICIDMPNKRLALLAKSLLINSVVNKYNDRFVLETVFSTNKLQNKNLFVLGGEYLVNYYGFKSNIVGDYMNNCKDTDFADEYKRVTKANKLLPDDEIHDSMACNNMNALKDEKMELAGKTYWRQSAHYDLYDFANHTKQTFTNGQKVTNLPIKCPAGSKKIVISSIVNFGFAEQGVGDANGRNFYTSGVSFVPRDANKSIVYCDDRQCYFDPNLIVYSHCTSMTTNHAQRDEISCTGKSEIHVDGQLLEIYTALPSLFVNYGYYILILCKITR